MLAARYFRSQRRGTGNASTLLSVLGIAVGVMTLTVVLAVMNGFQLGSIENIVEISSYHLQARSASTGLGHRVPDSERGARIRALPGVTAVVPYVERQALVQGAFQRPRACAVRAVPSALLDLDPVQKRMIVMQSGSFDLTDPRSIVIGSQLEAAMGARVGDTLTLTSYAPGAGGRPVPREDTFRVTGIFSTGYPDFDLGLVFISLAAADSLYGSGAALPRTWGVKLADRFNDAAALAAVSALLEPEGFVVQSWRSYNRSLFDALFVEKLVMMILVGLIFLVVGINVYHSQRRGVFERMEEIAVLKSVGVPPRRIRSVFVLQGLFIGIAGGAAGLATGLFLSVNVNAVFAGVEGAVNTLFWLVRQALLFVVPNMPVTRFAIFSPSSFYLTYVPSHVYMREAFLVTFFAVGACAVASWAAARAVSRFRPSEVLRYE
jgi:lipoprotein-releasing system permease protein